MSDGKKKEEAEGGFDVGKIVDRASQMMNTALVHSSMAMEQYGPTLANLDFILEPMRKAFGQVDEQIYKLSDKINTENPQIASMCRSHSSQLMLTTSVAVGTFVAYPTKRLFGGPFFRTFIYSGLFTAAAVAASCQLVAYKWERPRGPGGTGTKK